MKLHQILENHLQEAHRRSDERAAYQKYVKEMISDHFVKLTDVIANITANDREYQQMVDDVEDWLPERLKLYDVDEIYTGEGMNWASNALNVEGDWEEAFENDGELWKSYGEIYRDPETMKDFKYQQQLDRRAVWRKAGRRPEEDPPISREGITEYDDGPSQAELDNADWEDEIKEVRDEFFMDMWNFFEWIGVEEDEMEKFLPYVPQEALSGQRYHGGPHREFEDLFIRKENADAASEVMLSNPAATMRKYIVSADDAWEEAEEGAKEGRENAEYYTSAGHPSLSAAERNR